MLAAKLVSLLAFGGDALVVCGVHVLGVSNLGAEVMTGKDESAWQRVIIIWIPVDTTILPRGSISISYCQIQV